MIKTYYHRYKVNYNYWITSSQSAVVPPLTIHVLCHVNRFQCLRRLQLKQRFVR